MIGIQGQTFLIPAVANIPARDVPLIVMLILAVMTLLIGWKVLAGAAVLHVFSGLSGQGAAPGAGPARAGGGAGGGGGAGAATGVCIVFAKSSSLRRRLSSSS